MNEKKTEIFAYISNPADKQSTQARPQCWRSHLTSSAPACINTTGQLTPATVTVAEAASYWHTPHDLVPGDNIGSQPSGASS